MWEMNINADFVWGGVLLNGTVKLEQEKYTTETSPFFLLQWPKCNLCE